MKDDLIQISTVDSKPKRDPRALNAYRHGLTGQVHIGTTEEQDAYDKHCDLVHKGLAPIGDMETELAQTVADHRWRLKRAIAVESTVFSIGIAHSENKIDQHPEAFAGFAMAFKWLKDEKAIARIGLYLHRIQRDVEKSTKMFQELQQARQAAIKQVTEESNLLAQLAESKGVAYNPETDFPSDLLPAQFVFSKADIARHTTHLRGLTKARTLLRLRERHLGKAA